MKRGLIFMVMYKEKLVHILSYRHRGTEYM